ncbi:hypothetical protein [Paenibacillus durus]|uniref:hypothetical protein n=1 Tax=Paenibacillus durus TaxID=44251 RepID=UPI0004B0F778|nr:hypothetical protein [Paenibacillus durus]
MAAFPFQSMKFSVFRAYTDRAVASFTYHPYWDLLFLSGDLAGGPPQVYGRWTAFGMTGLTD